MISWEEPAFFIGTKKKQKMVFVERECLRCGIKQKRKFSENIDGTLAPAGWDIIQDRKQ
jgi:hypothetical protein